MLPVPDRDRRRGILLYEASEGGAGVLRHLVSDPSVLPRIASEALRLAHFDPRTLEDIGAEMCGAACYDCLLDYGNQPDHELLNRFAIRDVLAKLASSEVRAGSGGQPRPDHLAMLMSKCDSQLERKWLSAVDEHGLRLPSHAQFLIESCRTRPDFFYEGQRVAIYVDGPPHDEDGAADHDHEIAEALGRAGYLVLRFHHAEDWDLKFKSVSRRFRREAGMTMSLWSTGALVKARGREWIVLPESNEHAVHARPIGGLDEEVTAILLGIEEITPATFDLPDADRPGDHNACRLLRDAARLSTRSAAGPFRSFARIAVEPRPYQLVPLLMAMRLDPVRLLIADDVGIGKTIEASCIARELVDRGEVNRFAVLCPPHLVPSSGRKNSRRSFMSKLN